MAILRKLQIWQEFIGLAKIKTRWQKRHVDNCGFYENDKFCEIGEFGFINGLTKILNETTKEALLVCNHETRRQCWGSVQYNFSRIINMKIESGSQRRHMLLFLTTNIAAVTLSATQQYWQLAISRNWQIEKMGDWARIHQRFSKNSNEVTKRGSLTNGDYKKMANLGENVKFRKNREFKSLAKCKWDDKKGHIDKWQTWQIFIKVWQKCKQDDKRGMLIIVGFTKMTNFAKLANLAKDSFHVKDWKKI